MTFSLYLAGSTQLEDANLAESHDPQLTVSIDDADGIRLHTYSSPAFGWTWATGGGDIRLWHQSLRDMQFDPDDDYTLVVTVGDEATPSTPIRLIPELSGDGNELP